MEQNFKPAVIQGAARDFVSNRMGVFAGGIPHPVATSQGMTLEKVCAAFAPERPGELGQSDRAKLGRGMANAEFGNHIAFGAAENFRAGFQAAADHMSALRTVEIDKIGRPVRIGLAADGLVLQEKAEHERIGIDRVGAREETLTLAIFSRGGALSRQDIVNDDLHSLAGLAQSTGASAARTHGDLMGAKLLQNPILKDGKTVFIDGENDFPDRVLSPATIGLSMAALRRQPTGSGAQAGNKARFILVAGDLEFLALDLVQKSGLPLKVICLPSMTDGTWALMADPAAAPTLCSARLAGDKSILNAESKYSFNSDALLMEFSMMSSVGYASRVGIVRCGFTAAPAPAPAPEGE